MKKLNYLIILFVASRICEGQNLVPNGDFETYSPCPPGIANLSNAVGWVNPAFLTPDYFNQCSTGNAGVPSNIYGDQQAHSGVGYAGVYGSQIAAQPDVREYIAAQLLQPLQTGATYFAQFYLNLSGLSQYAVTRFGAYFSPSLNVPFIGLTINVIPQVENTASALTDTAGWMEISGTFTASGGEQYIIIGNFKNDANCGMQNVNGGSWNSAYYFIDDVTVSLVTGIEEQNSDDEISIYPNPVKDLLNVQISGTNFKSGKTEIRISDILGKEIYQNQFLIPIAIGTKFQIPTSNFKSGIYFIEIKNRENISRKKFIKE